MGNHEGYTNERSKLGSDGLENLRCSYWLLLRPNFLSAQEIESQ